MSKNRSAKQQAPRFELHAFIPPTQLRREDELREHLAELEEILADLENSRGTHEYEQARMRARFSLEAA